MSDSKKVTIFMIGLGRIGGRFYEKFTAMDQNKVEIIGISEPNMGNALIDDALARGIPNYPLYEEAVRDLGSSIDIIMDTSNRSEIKQALRKVLQETDNRHTVILPMVVDYLMWYLMDDKEMPQAHHKDIGY